MLDLVRRLSLEGVPGGVPHRLAIVGMDEGFEALDATVESALADSEKTVGLLRPFDAVGAAQVPAPAPQARELLGLLEEGLALAQLLLRAAALNHLVLEA